MNVYKFDKDSDADVLVKTNLGLTSIYTEESSLTIPDYIYILKTRRYLKFKTTEKKYDPASDSMKDKQVFYYILTSLNGKETITKDIPTLIQHIIEFYIREINNVFKGQTAFEDVYRDYKNKHPKEDMLDYSSAKRDFFEKSSMYGKQHPENVYTPYQSFLDTLVLYLIYILQDKYKSAFKKLKHKKSKSIRKFSKTKSKVKSKVKTKVKSKVLYEIKSKFFTHPPKYADELKSDDQKHEDIIEETYKYYKDLFDTYFSRIVNIKKETLDRFSKNLPSTLTGIISDKIDKKEYDNILKNVIAHMTAYRECKDNDNFVLYLLNLFKLFNDYFDKKDIDFQTLILFNVITTKIISIITDKTYRKKCPLDSEILKELKDKEQSIKNQVDEFLKTSNVTDLDLLLEEPKSGLDDVKSSANPDASNVSESKKKHKHNPDDSLALADLNLFLKDYQLYKSGNHDYDAFFTKLKSENLFKEGIVNLFKQKFVGFVSEITRYSSKDIFEIIKIVINLIFNKKPEPEYNPFKRIYSFLFDVEQLKRIQAFLDDLNTVIPNFDKIMIKDRDKNPFFLMYFLCNQGIYVELYCNGKVYKINNCSPKKDTSNPYKIHVSECYSTPLLQKFGIVEDGLTQTTETPGGGTHAATPGGSISHAASSQSKLPARNKTSDHKGSTMGGLGLAEEKDIFSQCSSASDITNLSPLDAVLYHQCKRFYELDLILSKQKDTIVVIAGNPRSGIHSLGKGFAVGSWGGEDNQDYKKMQANLTKYINYLVTKYKVRITFGNVGQVSKNKKAGEKGLQFNVTRDPVENYINVWGADVDNWNLEKDEKIKGGGHASSFETQAPGVFGICTMKPVSEDKKKKVLEISKYTTTAPGNPSQLLTPSPVRDRDPATPPRHSGWTTSDDSDRSGSDSDRSGSESESESESESKMPVSGDGGGEVVFVPQKAKKFVYYGTLNTKTAYTTHINLDTISKEDYHNRMVTLKELKELILTNLSKEKYLIRFFASAVLSKFIYLTNEAVKDMRELLVTTDSIKDSKFKVDDTSLLQNVFDTIEPRSSFKSKKSLVKKPTPKKSLLKKPFPKKSLLKKPAPKKSLVKKPAPKKSFGKKSSPKKSLLKKPTPKKKF